MQHRFTRITLLVMILTVLALTSPARAGEQVPFKGRSSGVVKTTTCQAPNQVCTILYGEGEATHLGHFTVIAHVVVDLVAETITGPWTLTAANGDVLFVTFEGFGIDETHGGGFMTVEGGTGRFQGATGNYTQRITFSPAPGTQPEIAYTDVLEGTISSPGSNR